MKPFVTYQGSVIPLMLSDIDTDMIIPAQYLTHIGTEGYGQYLFSRLRAADKDFPFNQPQFAKASILVAGDNFGCGSSREHAVWALMQWGIRVVIAPSFADIFASNSGKNGLLLCTVPLAQVEELSGAAQSGGYELSVDLPAQELSGPDFTCSFPMDPFRKHCFLNGLDDLEYLRQHQSAIDEYFTARATTGYFVERDA